MSRKMLHLEVTTASEFGAKLSQRRWPFRFTHSTGWYQQSDKVATI